MDFLEFEKRKKDHLKVALLDSTQSVELNQFDQIALDHQALPELDFSDISLKTSILGNEVSSPFFVSSMTAGHSGANEFNCRIAEAAHEFGWALGVGSQRRELENFKLGVFEAEREWVELRKRAPGIVLFGNIGISQLIHSRFDFIKMLVEGLGASALIIHLNSLQEVLQAEGTPHFRGGIEAIQRICERVGVPVIVKETGCGFSLRTLAELSQIGVAAIDVAGAGGTHWGRVEGLRNSEQTLQFLAAKTFENWGISTVESLFNAIQVSKQSSVPRESSASNESTNSALDSKSNFLFEVWASGGIRNGLDAAKCLAIGANAIGVARPILKAVSSENPDQEIRKMMQLFEFELKIAMFCTGIKNLSEFSKRKVWAWKNR